MITVITLMTSLAVADDTITTEEQEPSIQIDFDKPALIIEVDRPEPDLLILDLRQFILDKEAEEAEKQRLRTWEEQNAPLGC